MNRDRGRKFFILIGKTLGRIGLVVLGLFGILFFTVAVLIARYKQWERQEFNFLSGATNQTYSDADIDNLDESLSTFQSSLIEKENLRLTSNDFEILFIQSLEENNSIGKLEGIEMVTLNRSFDLYVKMQGYPWVIVRVWQRSEGSPDFLVYDVRVGPISLSTLSWGWVSSEFSNGVEDAMDLVFSDNFGGRKVTEIYIFENGIRLVGSLEEDSIDSK